jgi:hypothetical protein
MFCSDGQLTVGARNTNRGTEMDHRPTDTSCMKPSVEFTVAVSTTGRNVEVASHKFENSSRYLYWYKTGKN